MTTTNQPIVRRQDKGRWKDRYYVVDGIPELAGVELPSVTTVLSVISKPALIPWAVNQALDSVRQTLLICREDETTDPYIAPHWAAWVEDIIGIAKKRPDEVKDAAADYGTRAHVAISEHLVYGKEPEPDLLPALDAFLGWYRQSGITIDLSEHMVFSQTHGYAGAMDALGFKDQGRIACVVDFKTSSAIYPEMALQDAAYAKAYEEMAEIPVEEAWILRLPKATPKPGEPPFEAKQVKDLDGAFQGFLAALNLYRALKQEMWS